MQSTTLIVPGYQGSGPDHWQTWLESKIPNSRRIQNINWEVPELEVWKHQLCREIDACSSVWIIAHSFGCLVSVCAAIEKSDKILGTILVAPADPDRFFDCGLCLSHPHLTAPTISSSLPKNLLPGMNLVIASENDPWINLNKAKKFAHRWGANFLHLNNAGHINSDSGYGPFPKLLERFQQMQTESTIPILGSIDL
ncbi:MAG: alpha/beta hydrolase [Pseudomonadota bacterium]